MRACRDGGSALEQAMRTLDREHFAVLYRESRRTVRDAAAARDLVQETFIKVWQRCASFHGSSELLPWLRAILRHTMLDSFRRHDRTVSLDDAVLTAEVEQKILELSARAVATPLDEVQVRQQREVFQRCWAAFERDCPTHAAVIAWIGEDGLDNEAIAQLLGRTPGATREFISQCRKKARVYLAEWYQLAFGARES
ncbi:MAG: sigma-70 family RNA polymerase sigma factor [Steroidobacteraceae bacterium]|nr:sigma-70 family RNA polymerase sigma factor [Steroidobacteraceae bacterium]